MDAIRHGHKEVQALLRACGGHMGDTNVADKLCKAAAENDIEALQVGQMFTPQVLRSGSVAGCACKV